MESDFDFSLLQNRHWSALWHLITSRGVLANCMTPGHDSGALYYCVEVVGGFVIAEDGNIYPPEDVIYQ